MSSAGFTEQYDRLVAALGEDPLRSGAPLQRAEDPARAAVTAQPAERARLLEALTGQSLRCAELISQTLATSGSLSRLQTRLATAEASAGGEDERMDEENSEEDEEEEERSALLLQDLVTAGARLEETATQHAQLGVADKALRSSRALLAGAERELSAVAGATGQSGGSLGDGALQSEFRALYVDEFAAAFGDSLDAFRREEQFESRDVAYLISCIHAGGDVFSPLQQALFVESVKASGGQQ